MSLLDDPQFVRALRLTIPAQIGLRVVCLGGTMLISQAHAVPPPPLPPISEAAARETIDGEFNPDVVAPKCKDKETKVRVYSDGTADLTCEGFRTRVQVFGRGYVDFTFN